MKFHGVTNLGFLQVRRGTLMQSQMLSGVASVNTISQTMDIYFSDHSTYYPNATILQLENDEDLKNIAVIAQEHITAIEISNCDVTLTRLKDSWHVLCTELDSGPLGKRIHEFKIDLATLEIVDEQN